MKVFFIILLASTQAMSMDLNEFLETVSKSNHTVQSYQSSKQAAELRQIQNDIVLSPYLNLKSSYLDDKSYNGTDPAFINIHEVLREDDVGVSKLFSTGTNVNLQGSIAGVAADSLVNGVPASFQQGFSSLGLIVSQDLWKDSFGEETRLRKRREDSQKKLEVLSNELQIKQVTISAEQSFWDSVYLNYEMGLRKDSLERAKKIESWITNRASNGIGDKADVLTAKSLTTNRVLQMQVTESGIVSSQKSITLLLEAEQVPELTASLDEKRPLRTMVEKFSEKGKIVRLDSYLTLLQARVKQVMTKEVDDRFKPDLSLQGSYRTNGYGATMGGVSNQLTATDRPTEQVALVFSMPLDNDVKSSARRTAKLDELAAEQLRYGKFLESDVAWADLNRRYDDLTQQIETAETILKIQRDRTAAYRNKLQNGRAITSDVISAEQDNAEAELNLYKLKAEQRKLEAQAKLFVQVEETI